MGVFDTVKKIVSGDVAHDAADAGNPIKIGGKATTSKPAGVAGDDRVDARFDVYGHQWVKQEVGYSYAYYYGGLAGGLVQQDDIMFQRGASPTFPLSDFLTTTAEVLDYFDTDDAAFDATGIWVYIPMAEQGYTKANIMIRNVTGVNADITAYMIPGNDALLSVGPISANAFRYVGDTDGVHTVATGGFFYIGLGTDGDDTPANRICSSWITGGLLLLFDPASDPPGGGHWLMTIQRGL